MRKGQKMTFEQIEKMKLSLKGRKAWNKGKKYHQKPEVAAKFRILLKEAQKYNTHKFQKGHIPASKGKPMPEHVKEAIRKANKGRPSWNKGGSAPKGENSPNWKGGRWQLHRKKALERDNYTCQICGLREIEIMEVDHKKPKGLYPELQYELSNLWVLCPNCHARKTSKEKSLRSVLRDMEKVNGNAVSVAATALTANTVVLLPKDDSPMIDPRMLMR